MSRTGALWASATVWEGPDDVDARQRNGHALLAHGQARSEPVAVALGHHYLGWAALERGDGDAARLHHAASLHAASTSSHAHLAAQAADTRFLTTLIAGEFGQAAGLAEELGAAWRRSADPGTAFVVEVSARVLLGELTDGTDALLPHFKAIREAMPGEVMWRLADALTHALAGRNSDADDVIAQITASELRAIPRTATWTGNVSGMAHIADLRGNRDLAAIALDHLTPITGAHIVCGGFAYRGSVAHWQGVCLHATGHLDAAEAKLREAVSAHERVASPPWLAQSKFALARLQLGHTDPRLRAIGRAQIEQATTIASRLGMRTLQRRIDLLPT